MVRHPSVFLMDEPLSNLDAKLRVHMRAELADLHRRLGATFIYVTHDQSEAMTMSDRVAVMMDGELLQVAPPAALYDDPADLRVAEFVGSPKINVLPGMVAADGAVECARRARCRSRWPRRRPRRSRSACAANMLTVAPARAADGACAARFATSRISARTASSTSSRRRASARVVARAGRRRAA